MYGYWCGRRGIITNIAARRSIARIALNENASRLEQNAAASPFPCVKKDSPLALTKPRVDSPGGGGGGSVSRRIISRGGGGGGDCTQTGF